MGISNPVKHEKHVMSFSDFEVIITVRLCMGNNLQKTVVKLAADQSQEYIKDNLLIF